MVEYPSSISETEDQVQVSAIEESKAILAELNNEVPEQKESQEVSDGGSQIIEESKGCPAAEEVKGASYPVEESKGTNLKAVKEHCAGQLATMFTVKCLSPYKKEIKTNYCEKTTTKVGKSIRLSFL